MNQNRLSVHLFSVEVTIVDIPHCLGAVFNLFIFYQKHHRSNRDASVFNFMSSQVSKDF